MRSALSPVRGGFRRRPPTAEAGAILQLFQQADLDGNGEISEAELAAVFGGSLSAEQVHALVVASDADKDGTLDYSEFFHWVFNDALGDEQLLKATISVQDLSSRPRADVG